MSEAEEFEEEVIEREHPQRNLTIATNVELRDQIATVLSKLEVIDKKVDQLQHQLQEISHTQSVQATTAGVKSTPKISRASRNTHEEFKQTLRRLFVASERKTIAFVYQSAAKEAVTLKKNVRDEFTLEFSGESTTVTGDVIESFTRDLFSRHKPVDIGDIIEILGINENQVKRATDEDELTAALAGLETKSEDTVQETIRKQWIKGQNDDNAAWIGCCDMHASNQRSPTYLLPSKEYNYYSASGKPDVASLLGPLKLEIKSAVKATSKKAVKAIAPKGYTENEYDLLKQVVERPFVEFSLNEGLVRAAAIGSSGRHSWMFIALRDHLIRSTVEGPSIRETYYLFPIERGDIATLWYTFNSKCKEDPAFYCNERVYRLARVLAAMNVHMGYSRVKVISFSPSATVYEVTPGQLKDGKSLAQTVTTRKRKLTSTHSYPRKQHGKITVDSEEEDEEEVVVVEEESEGKMEEMKEMNIIRDGHTFVVKVPEIGVRANKEAQAILKIFHHVLDVSSPVNPVDYVLGIVRFEGNQVNLEYPSGHEKLFKFSQLREPAPSQPSSSAVSPIEASTKKFDECEFAFRPQEKNSSDSVSPDEYWFYYRSLKMTVSPILPSIVMELGRPIATVKEWELHNILVCINEARVLHTDLRPPNLMVFSGNRGRIVDFDLAEILPKNEQKIEVEVPQGGRQDILKSIGIELNAQNRVQWERIFEERMLSLVVQQFRKGPVFTPVKQPRSNYFEPKG